MQECDLIKNSLEISHKLRPQWDLHILKQLQFQKSHNTLGDDSINFKINSIIQLLYF